MEEEDFLRVLAIVASSRRFFRARVVSREVFTFSLSDPLVVGVSLSREDEEEEEWKTGETLKQKKQKDDRLKNRQKKSS